MMSFGMFPVVSNLVVILISLFMLSNEVFAVGFGQAVLHSHLGEPLDVRVPLLLSGDEKIQQFSIRLASEREYGNLEQTIPHAYLDIRTDIESTKNSVPQVYISSASAIDESIIVLVLKVKRGRGNFYKKMQFFLDASDIKPRKKTAWTYTPDATVRSVSKETETNNQGVVAGFIPMNAPSNSFDGGWSRRSSYGPVQYGDSLSEIAFRLRKDKRWSNRQVMLALYDNNQDAFVNNNINQLKKGRFLTVPDDMAMQSFVGSKRFQTLKPKLLKKLRGKKVKKVKKEAAPISTQNKATPKFSGRISLGLQESLVAPTANPDVLKRLDKLEPMYQQAMATSLRMDGIGGKVDALAKEVSQLNAKIDALTKGSIHEPEQGVSYAWLGFALLLLLNIILLAGYLYRKQMKIWQNKLLETQQQFTHTAVEEAVESVEPKKEAVIPSPMLGDGTDNNPFGQYEDFADISEPVVQSESELNSGYEPESIPDLDLGYEPEQEQESDTALDEDEVIEIVDHAMLFEESVHKREWARADEHFELMPAEDRERPRTQALLVQKLHSAGEIMERNMTLLTLSRLYDDNQWHRFCSCFDEDVWYEMQNEKIISLTGKVVEIEMHKESYDLEEPTRDIKIPKIPMLDAEPHAFEKSVQDIVMPDLDETGPFDITLDDLDVGNKVNVTSYQNKTPKVEEEDSLVDMGTVEHEEIEHDEIEPMLDAAKKSGGDESAVSLVGSIMDDLELELHDDDDDDETSGNDDTVMITEEMLKDLAKNE